MALGKFESCRDSMLIKASGEASARGWGTWASETLAPWASLVSSAEAVKVPAGRWLMQVLTGQPLVYEKGANKGRLSPGTYTFDGALTVYTQYPSDATTAIITRLA